MPNALGCYCVWDDAAEGWECVKCSFTTSDDRAANLHGMTGTDQLLDHQSASD